MSCPPLTAEEINIIQNIIEDGNDIVDIIYAVKFLNKERERCRIKQLRYLEKHPRVPSGNPPGRPRKNQKIDPAKNIIPVKTV
jgi:hypothetical protein